MHEYLTLKMSQPNPKSRFNVPRLYSEIKQRDEKFRIPSQYSLISKAHWDTKSNPIHPILSGLILPTIDPEISTSSEISPEPRSRQRRAESSGINPLDLFRPI